MNIQTILSLSLLAIGLGLLAMMVITEGEPGALPLSLVVVGGAWVAATRLRAKRRK
jgi:hypothetical protein